jgi:curved DNA-binding protein CbpA
VTLYEILGVSREATSKEIRAAYRAKAKIHHPDSGGTKEEFGRLQMAYRVLMDPKLRKTYDQTGRIDEPAADTHRAEILSILVTTLDRAAVPAPGENPLMRDLVGSMTIILMDQERERQDHLTRIKQVKDLLIKMKKRFKKKRRVEEGQNIFDVILDAKIMEADREISVTEHKVNMLKEVLSILSDYEFEFDEIRVMMSGVRVFMAT